MNRGVVQGRICCDDGEGPLCCIELIEGGSRIDVVTLKIGTGVTEKSHELAGKYRQGVDCVATNTAFIMRAGSQMKVFVFWMNLGFRPERERRQGHRGSKHVK